MRRHRSVLVALLTLSIFLLGGLGSTASWGTSVAPPAGRCSGASDYEKTVNCLDATVEVSSSGGVVTGSLYISGSGATVRRQQTAPPGCPGCVWTVTYICDVRVDTDSQGVCSGGSNRCGDAQQLVHVGLTVDGRFDSEYDFCPPPGDLPRPIALSQVVDRLLADGQRRSQAPAPQVRFQPASGAVTQLPAYFTIEDDNRAPLEFQVVVPEAPQVVLDVTVTPTSWRWDFGDDRSLETSDPGGDYPNGRVTHTYTRRGTVTVSTTTTSAVSQTVRTPDGELPAQTAPVAVSPATLTTLPVREGRAVLVLILRPRQPGLRRGRRRTRLGSRGATARGRRRRDLRHAPRPAPPTTLRAGAPADPPSAAATAPRPRGRPRPARRTPLPTTGRSTPRPAAGSR